MVFSLWVPRPPTLTPNTIPPINLFWKVPQPSLVRDFLLIINGWDPISLPLIFLSISLLVHVFYESSFRPYQSGFSFLHLYHILLQPLRLSPVWYVRIILTSQNSSTTVLDKSERITMRLTSDLLPSLLPS